ncbi:aldehyde dehydrogenase (NADP(+)) [Sodalis sp. dw_96]|uniref:aldehyde dehydrogenase (NADP(+)) n=1 Tax=Sodalis sp. dw_96 TaxID=2719794 RepID=UPI001BD56AF4|nr:aldehyde dehydrogenase (NADP(+)) [Sodalis sp. dw_96]
MSVSHTAVIGGQFIAGDRVAAGRDIIRSLCAATGEPTGYAYYQATAEEARQAAQAAADAFPAYSQTDSAERARFLTAIADEIDALDENFLQLAHLETALPLPRLQGEKARTSGQLRLFAQLLARGDTENVRIDTALPERRPLPRPDLRQYQLALGPVAVFGASNFPLAFSTAGGDTASALAAGCTVVFKAHSGHPATAEGIAMAIERARVAQNLPAGVFNMIFGDLIGAELVQAPAIQAVGFTGSLKGGRALCDLAARRPQPIPVFAEMSSVNPLLVLPNALNVRGEQIARDLVASFTLGAGQFCTKPGLIIAVAGEAFDRFINQLAQWVNDAPPQFMLHAGILENYRQGVARWDRHPALRQLAEGKTAANQAASRLYQGDKALLLSAVDPVLQEEVFGPLAAVVAVDNLEELLAVLDHLQGQLTATLLAEPADLPLTSPLCRRLLHKAGRVLFNGYPTGVEVSDAMVHGGPWPATSDAHGTSVGTLAISRFQRPVCLQNWPAELLPPPLLDANPLNLLRLVNGEYTRDSITGTTPD